MEKKRIVFVNLHGNEFLVKTLNKYIFKQSVAIKHRYFLDFLLENDDFEVCSYVNPVGFSLASNLNPRIMKILYLFRFLEHYIVLRLNKIPAKKIKLIKRASDISEKDIVLLYQFCEPQFYKIDEINGVKVVSMMHFSGSNTNSKLTQLANPEALLCESNLQKHSLIFNENYKWFNKKIIVIPFVFEDRFQNIKPFDERENRAFATGTITYRNDKYHLDVYKQPCVQPARKQIVDCAKELSPFIECTSRDYLEDASAKVKNKSTSFFSKLYMKTHTSQKQYYSFNMVDSFNSFRMCIVGEEILGIPGIGFVEGIACGCAYIGQNKGYYEDYGMVEGIHYIGYDGTINDLREKIKYYQMPEHYFELKEIALNGYNFAQKHFSKDVVATQIISELLKLSN